MDLLKKVRGRTILFSLGLLGLAGGLLAVEISPSKYQGGTTNDIPNRTGSGSPALLSNPFRWMFGSARSSAMERVHAPPDFKVELTTEPKNFTPQSNAVLQAKMTVLNESKEKYILEFTTAQHYDFAIVTKGGEEVYRSSRDKEYSQQKSSIVLNRNEKLVYEEEIFSPSNQVINLPAGEYKLVGQITAQVPISVESVFQISQ